MSDIHIRGDLNLFRVMLAIVEEGSTIGAANRLNISQSAVSHALKRLREMLNDPVFIKHGRYLVLTPHGRSILPEVEQALSSLANCNAKSGTFDPVHSELQFFLGFRDILEYLALPKLLQPLREFGSKCQFDSKRIAPQEMEEALLSSSVDVAIELEYPVGEKIASEEVSREYLCAMVGPAHPSYKTGVISLEEFVNQYHALVTLEKRERAFVDHRMGGVGQQRKVLVHCEHYLAAAQTVAKSDLILTMPFSYAAHLAEILGVRLLPLPFPIEPLPVRMYWRAETSGEPYMQWLLEQLRHIMQRLPEYNLGVTS